jgi:hypothetical protein
MNCSSVDCSGLIGIGFKLMPLCDGRLVFDMFSASWMPSGTTVFDCTCAVDMRVGSPVGLIMVTGRTFRFLCCLADGYEEFLPIFFFPSTDNNLMLLLQTEPNLNGTKSQKSMSS